MLGIVILNYLNYKDTVECLETIKNQKGTKLKVVVVDNCSENNSAEKLVEIFSNDKDISIIKTKENLGYAKGNNVGINYLRKLGIDKIFILNNDTVITDPYYFKKIGDFNYSTKVGVVGTKIIGADGFNQNPVYKNTNFIEIVKPIIGLLLRKMKLRRHRENIKKKNNNNIVSNKHFFLHGSGLLLTEHFFSYYNGFYPETFLYVEENIIDIMLRKAQLKSIYVDEIEFYHKEDQSSLMSFNNNSKFKNKYLLNSFLIALKVLFLSKDNIKNRILNQKYSFFVLKE